MSTKSTPKKAYALPSQQQISSSALSKSIFKELRDWVSPIFSELNAKIDKIDKQIATCLPVNLPVSSNKNTTERTENDKEETKSNQTLIEAMSIQ